MHMVIIHESNTRAIFALNCHLEQIVIFYAFKDLAQLYVSFILFGFFSVTPDSSANKRRPQYGKGVIRSVP